jgi:pimeloyl-ACP methyl ester carboxylesterase
VSEVCTPVFRLSAAGTEHWIDDLDRGSPNSTLLVELNPGVANSVREVLDTDVTELYLEYTRPQLLEVLDAGRRELLRIVVLSLRTLERTAVTEEQPASPAVIRGPRGHVVILIHGIRTQGEWHRMATTTLDTDATIRAVATRYGFLDVIRFLLPFEGPRRRPVERILRILRDELGQHPEYLSVVAHSFGTFIVSRILQSAPDVRLHRLILCGSIISDDFEWDLYGHRFTSGDEAVAVNECGNRDIWPVLAKSVTWGYGSSGRFGFGHGRRVVDRFHTVGHSGFFSTDFVRRFWLPYLTTGLIVPGEDERPRTHWLVNVMTVLPLRYVLPVLLVLLLWRLAYLSS